MRHEDRRIVGAGILLGPDTVLTAAHVVAPGGRFVVEFVGAPGGEVASVRATVLDGAYVPERVDEDGDPSGDVALLRLEHPMPAGHTVALQRLYGPDRAVQIYGFPEGYNGGMRLRATVVGGVGRDGQVQLGPVRLAELARPGCSGAGVMDMATGQVVGMLLSTIPEPDGGFSLMSPAETIVRHLPQVERWTRGRGAVDESLRSVDDGEFDEAFALGLADWFRGDGRQVKTCVVRADDRVASATLLRAINLADRELRTRASFGRLSSDPPATVPSAGGHDLAVNAAGLSVEEFAGRITERTGLWQDREVPAAERIRHRKLPLTVVVVGVDEAADPPGLLDLLAVLRRQGSRLLLVFRAAGALHDRAVADLVTAPERERRTGLLTRLEEITGPLADAVRRGAALVRADTAAAERVLGRARALRTLLAEGEAGAGEAARPPGAYEPGQDAGQLAAYERFVDRAHGRVKETAERLAALARRRDELSGRLHPYEALYQSSNAQENAENLRAAALYRTACDRLEERPCDVAAAERAVRAYIAFVERSLRGERFHEGEGEPQEAHDGRGREGGAPR